MIRGRGLSDFFLFIDFFGREFLLGSKALNYPGSFSAAWLAEVVVVVVLRLVVCSKGLIRPGRVATESSSNLELLDRTWSVWAGARPGGRDAAITEFDTIGFDVNA